MIYFIKKEFVLNSITIFSLFIVFIINIFIIENTKVINLLCNLYTISLFNISNTNILFYSFINNIILGLILYSFLIYLNYIKYKNKNIKFIFLIILFISII